MMKTDNINVSIDSVENPVYTEARSLQKELEKTQNEILELLKEKANRLEKEINHTQSMHKDSFDGKSINAKLLNE